MLELLMTEDSGHYLIYTFFFLNQLPQAGKLSHSLIPSPCSISMFHSHILFPIFHSPVQFSMFHQCESEYWGSQYCAVQFADCTTNPEMYIQSTYMFVYIYIQSARNSILYIPFPCSIFNVPFPNSHSPVPFTHISFPCSSVYPAAIPLCHHIYPHLH